MVSASETPDRVDRHRSFVDAAVDAGVERLIYTSFHRAGPDATFTLARDHWATEEYIRASGLSATFLRNSRYQDEAVPQAYASRAAFGAPDWQVDAWVSTYTAVAAGEMAFVSRDVQDLTGHPATSFESLLRGRPSGR